MENEENVKQIDLRLVFKKIGEHKKLFFIILPIVIALSFFVYQEHTQAKQLWHQKQVHLWMLVP